jgi:RNA polymerase sigma factor (sigma-70 family)
MNLNDAYQLYKDDPGANQEVFGTELLKYCQSITRNEDDASEGIVRVFEKMNDFRGESNFTTWVHSILTHKNLDRIRHESWEAPLEEARLKTHDGGIFDIETRLSFKKALLALTPKEQEFVRLKVSGFSPKELGERFKMSEHSVENELKKIIRKCKKLVSEGGPGPN